MFSRLKKFLRIMIAVTAAIVLAGYCGIRYLSDYCTDKIPDTSSVYVYTVDRGVEDLNRKYIDGKRIKPSDESRYITYEDIPDISLLPGVEDIYIFDDKAMTEFSDGIYSGRIKEAYVSMPVDVLNYFGDPSGMNSMFGLNPSGNPHPDAEYALIYCTGNTCEWAEDASGHDVVQFYYKYDAATWDEFMKSLDEYLIEYDAISEVSMLVTVTPSSFSKSDAAALQDILMVKYPGSNYLSAEFARVFRNETNKDYWLNVATAAAVVIVVTIAIEFLPGIIVKRQQSLARKGQ